jgi:hypothetical protein
MRAAQVNAAGLVVNVMLMEPGDLAAFRPLFEPDELIVCGDEVGPGFTYVDGEFIAPPEPDPDAPNPQPEPAP